MLRGLLSNRIVTYLLIVVVCLAIWKANNGDLSHIADAAWEGINKAADTLLGVWNHFAGGDPKKS